MIKENEWPDGWKIVKLNEVITSISNGITAQQNDENKGHRVTRIETISKAIIDLTRTNFVELDENKYNKFKLNDGDILFSHINSTKHIGKTAMYNSNMGTLIHGMNLLRLIPKKDLVLPKFLVWRLKNKDSLAYFQTRCKQSVNQSSLDQKIIKSFEFILPPLPTQAKIVAILEKAERLREWRSEADELTDEFLKSTFLELFGDPVANPKGFDLIKFSNIGSLQRGKSKHRPRNAPELLGGEYPLIQTGDVANSRGYIKEYNQTYSELGLNQSKMWPAGTLCITIAANIAKTGILTFDACFPDSVVGFTPNKNVKMEFVQFWLSFLQKTLEESAPESAQKNINLKILSNLDVPLPSFELQQTFADIVQQVEQMRTYQNQSKQHIDDLFNVLMQKAFKGELM